MTVAGVSYIQPFSATVATEVEQAGGKGAMLARLFQADLPVPAGWIITSRALTACLEHHRMSASSAPEEARHMVSSMPLPAWLHEDLQRLLQSLTASPAGWAVRSSAVAEDSTTASFAGVYESFLDIRADNLGTAIQACWASWWSERALAYRQRLEAGQGAWPQMAVVLQPMVAARCAGVAFTVEPLSGDSTRLVINAAPGVGVAVVSGVVQPEQYVVAKGLQPQVTETRLLRPEQPPLLPTEVILALARLLQKIETFCAQPQDVEWAWDGDRCWILQSRPITTLAPSVAARPEIVWGNANLKDVIPGLVSPFTWSLMEPELAMAVRSQYAQMGYEVPETVPIIRRHWGRPYFNLSLFHSAAYRLYGATPEQQVAQLGGAMVRGFTPPASVSFWQRWRWLANALRFSRIAERARTAAPASFAMVTRHWREELQQAAQLDRAALLQKLTTFAAIFRPFLLQHLVLTAAMSGNFSHLRACLARWLPQASPGLVAELVTGLGDMSSAEHSYRLWELSRLARQSPQVMAFLQQRDWSVWPQALAGTAFADAWQAFLEAYGHRSLYEIEMANPRWREQPGYLFEVIEAYTRLPQDTSPFDPQVQAQRRQQAELQVWRQLSGRQRWWLRIVLGRTQEFSRLRENSKLHLVQLIDIGRCMALTAARFLAHDGLLDESEAVFFLAGEEIRAALQGEYSPAEIAQRLARRRLERQRYTALQAPEVFLGERPVYDQPLGPQGLVLHGLPSSPGRVTGTARVLRSPQEGGRLQAGEILVAPSTDPGWTPLFLLAAGLVMETGGYLSHGAIVAREYGIPAVLNIPLATQRIADGATITLDGGTGTISLRDADVPQQPCHAITP